MTHILAHLEYGSNTECGNQQHQLLHSRTILQCIMLNADVVKEGGGLVKCGQLRTGGDRKMGHFLWTSFTDDPSLNIYFSFGFHPTKFLTL